MELKARRLASRKTLSRCDWITLVISWSALQETGLARTSTGIPRAGRWSDCHTSPSASNTKRSCSGINHCSWHIDDILQAATMRPSVNQVEYHIGPDEVGDGSRDRSLDASQEGYLDDFYWFFEAPPTKLPDASMCSREQCVS